MSGNQLLRVASIRKQNPCGFGGAIFSCKQIDEDGNVTNAGSYVVVRAAHSVLGDTKVECGQWWRVGGHAAERTIEVNGFAVVQQQIEATHLTLARTSGDHIILFMAKSSLFAGMGVGKGRRLWNRFGDHLYHLLDVGDIDALSTVVTREVATKTVEAWAKHGHTRALQWLQARGFDTDIGGKVLEFFGDETPDRLKEDPYRLLSFCAGWRQVDALARTEFGLAEDDPRRLQGAIEEACYRVFGAGHTTVLQSTLIDTLQGVLGPQSKTFAWRRLVPSALAQGLSNGSFVVGQHGVHPLGALVMERQVAKAVADRLLSTDDQTILDADKVEDMLDKFEAGDGIVLNAEQRQAVQMAAASKVLVITGGAGVGKTTVLKVIYDVLESAGIEVVQLALAGRAAKRMKEATGREASTIAHFLHTWKDGQLSGPCAVVIDEGSMVDIVTMSRLCELLPEHVRMILVGDPAQLMPVGPGLVLHALVRVPQVPVVELKVVERYGDEIASIATSVREGIWPSIVGSEMSPVVFVSVNGGAIDDEVLRLYQQDPKDTQILCARKGNVDGVENLNERCQQTLTAEASPVVAWSSEFDQPVRTGMHLGDPVLCTRNLWDRGLQNGSLGTVVELGRPAAESEDDESGADKVLAWVDWDDNIRRPLTESMLDDIALGYAITVHKAQGSQWQRVIVPITKSRLLDRTLVYTALTRARRQVVLVGDESAARAAVENMPHVQRRKVALDLILQQMLEPEVGA